MSRYDMPHPNTVGYSIPEMTFAALVRYVESRCITGGFLQAVMRNDLMDAVGRADSENRAALADIAAYIYNFIPERCWGSHRKINEWIEGEDQPKGERHEA